MREFKPDFENLCVRSVSNLVRLGILSFHTGVVEGFQEALRSNFLEPHQKKIKEIYEDNKEKIDSYVERNYQIYYNSIQITEFG